MNAEQSAWPPQIGRLTLQTLLDRLRAQVTVRLQYRVPSDQGYRYRILAALFHDRARGIFENEATKRDLPTLYSGNLVVTHLPASDGDISGFFAQIFGVQGGFLVWADPKLTPAEWVEKVWHEEPDLNLSEKDRLKRLYAAYVMERG